LGGYAAPGRGASDPYAELLNDKKITADIIWEAESGPVSYPSWSVEQKKDLSRALAAVEAGEPAGLTTAPAPIEPIKVVQDKLDGRIFASTEPVQQCEDDGHVFYTSADAWKLYLTHVAHSLWLERHGKVAWSLKTMTKPERALLLDSRLLQKRKDKLEFEATRFVMGHALSWDPSIAYRFLVEKGLLGDTPEKTVVALTGWASRNLRHIRGSETFAGLYGYPGPVPMDRFLRPGVPGPWKVGGCWGVTGFYAGALRGANIPVESSINGQHSRPFFPTAGLALHHGDDIYTSWVGPSGNAAPPERLLLTRDEWKRLADSPELDCADGKCNSREEQTEYNVERRQILLAGEYHTDGPMYEYASKGRDYLDGSLRGYRVGDDELHTFAKPYLSTEERMAFIAEVEAELKRIGGGDIKEGGEIVRLRVKAFWR